MQPTLIARLLKRPLLFAAGLVLSAGLALAQATTGTIEGRVRNVGNDRYLNNVRITIEGTNRETFTNDYGEYRLEDVPVGPATVKANFTGLDAQTVSVTVAPDAIAKQNFDLTSRDRYGDDKSVVLDQFVVQSNREYEGNALATNEQRYAPNVKVVVSAQAFGDISEGNPGEFLKYLPGISVDYVAADVRTVSVRGFASNFTTVSQDGMRMTSSASGSNNRIFEFEQVSINNISRTEVTKIPTPDTPADSLGGSINFISKNAFERRGAQLNYRAYLNGNKEDLQVFKRTAGPGDDQTFKVLPNFDFDYTLPFSDRFGIVVTGLSSNQFVEQHRWQPTWNYQQAGGSVTAPYLQQWQLQDGPKTTNRASLAVKADYKIADHQIVSVSVQDNYYKSFFGNRNLNFNVGTNAVPTPATGTPLLFGPDFVQSATGRATVTQGSSFRDKLGNTAALNLRYTGDFGDYTVAAGANSVVSKTWYRALGRGHFANIGTSLQGVSVVRADNIAFPYLNWVARDAANAIVDPYSLNNYRLTTATNDPIDGKATMKGFYTDVERHFDKWVIPISIKTGINVREESRDNRRYSESYTYVGPDGVANSADDNAFTYIDPQYSGQDPYFRSPKIQWVDAFKLSQAYRDHPTWFTTNQVTNETFRRTNSEKITETISAGYVQIDGKALKNRLRFVTGVRWEKTGDRGAGVLSSPDDVFQRNANGTFVDSDPNTAGIQTVRRPEAGAVGSIEELNIIRKERAYTASKQYEGYYPSLNLTYNITQNFLARLAYAKTLGRSDYANIIPNADINEDEASGNVANTVITIRNTGLRPWTADNYEASLEYYFDKGGLITAGAFQKNLKDFWTVRGGTLDAALAAQLGVDPKYIGASVSTLVNGGEAGISGVEFNAVQPLSFLPSYLGYLTLKANGTMIHLTGSNVPDFRGFISKTGNFSLSYNHAPVVVNVNLNYRGRQKGTTITAPALQTGAQYGTNTGFYEYYAPRWNTDVSAEYRFTKRLALFTSARNIFNKEQKIERFSAASATYAKGFRQEEFGVNFSLGIKGTF